MLMKTDLIDSNLLIYLAGREHEKKREKINQLCEKKEFIISSQSLREVCSVLLYKYDFYPEKIINIVEYIKKTFEIIEDSSEDVLEALKIHEKNKISFWDSLLVATMKRNRIETIYTEDKAFEKIAGIKTVNPFK